MKWSEVKSLSHVRLFATPRTVAYQAPWFMGFSKQERWSGLPFPTPIKSIGAHKSVEVKTVGIAMTGLHKDR